MTCPACQRPVALARAQCLYCGAALPAEAVAAAAESARALSGPALPDAEAAPPSANGVILVVDLSGAEVSVVAEALGLSAYEASLRVRRGGLQFLRVAASAEEAGREAERLAGRGLAVIQAPEAEVRAALSPVLALGGRLENGALRLRADEVEVVVGAGELRFAARGPIVREYGARAERKRLQTASLDPGYRFHLYRAGETRPIELDPGGFSFEGATASASSLLVLARWIEAIAGSATIDDDFRRLPPVLAPAEPTPGDAAAEALIGRRPKGGTKGKPMPAILDNVAQFRFYSGWRAAATRQRRGPGG